MLETYPTITLMFTIDSAGLLKIYWGRIRPLFYYLIWTQPITKNILGTDRTITLLFNLDTVGWIWDGFGMDPTDHFTDKFRPSQIAVNLLGIDLTIT